MPDFKINDVHAIDLLIFWVTGIDGDVGFREIKDVGDVLEELRYDPTELGERTMKHVKSLSSHDTNQLIQEAKQFVADNFDDHRKNNVVNLLESMAKTDGDLIEREQKRLQELKTNFSV